MSNKHSYDPTNRAPKSAAMNKVEHRGYTIVQSARSHRVAIGKNGKVLNYGSSNHTMTDKELRQAVDAYIALTEAKKKASDYYADPKHNPTPKSRKHQK